MNTDATGVYGNYYLKRAMIAQVGLGANLPEDAIYPLNLADDSGAPLDGANKYTIHFDKGTMPPVNAFWSLTLYDREGFPGSEQAQSLCGEQLDAVQFGWRPRPLFAERDSWNEQGGQLASGIERAIQSDDAALRTEVRRPHRQMEPASNHKDSACVELDGSMKLTQGPASSEACRHEL
jgi:hypothetical protein